MSLYDELENEEEKKEKQDQQKPSWNANLKLLQSHIQLKKAALTQQRDKSRLPAVQGTSTEPSKKRRFDSKSVVVAEAVYALPKERNVLFEDFQVQDEYNPLYPNDYEKITKKRDEERQKRKEEEKRKASEDRDRRKKDRWDHDSRRSDDEDDDDRQWRKDREKRSGGAAIAPPPSLTAESASRPDETEMKPGAGFMKPLSSVSKGLNVAAKIMEKYGYRQGGGLGKQEQGMSTALQVEKTGLRGGKIIHEKDTPKDFLPPLGFLSGVSIGFGIGEQEADAGPSITDLLKNPTKVVLLQNMIGPGEVDDDLDGEIREEMGKYGEVVNVLIFEIPGAPPEEAVRIFIEYAKIDLAIKALVALNGRFFGGRSIRASFYSYEEYKKFELGD